MDLLNNANTIASLVMALIGLCGSLYGVVTYLKQKASGIPQDAVDASQKASTTSKRPSSGPLQQLTWLEWAELSAQGLVDTADFILSTSFQNMQEELEELSIIARLGYCLLFCGIVGGIGVLILGLIINALLSGLGVQNTAGASGVIAFILLFTLLSFVYIYHVGRRVEEKRKQQYLAHARQQQARQSVRQ